MPEEVTPVVVTTIEDLANKGKEIGDCTVRGIIIDVKQGSGLVIRCPECKRVMQRNICRLHGNTVKGVPDLRIKVALDDGTGAIIVILHREITEKITTHTLDYYRAMVCETANPDSVRADIMEKVIARPIEVRGRVNIDDYGLMMIATDAKIIDVAKELVETAQRTLQAEENGTGR